MDKVTKILVVEDEAVVRHDLLHTLQESGNFQTDHTPSGTQALEKARDFKPDLILMDIMLQNGLDGIDIANQIKSQFDIPVIYISAFSDTKLLKRAKVTQPYGYIIKPYNTRELLTSIEMALYKHKMEIKLKASEEKFRSIFENANDSIISLDQDRKIVDVNQRALKIFGYKKSGMLELSFKELNIFAPADIERFDLYLTHISQGLDSNLEISVKNRKGKIYCLEFSATVMKVSESQEQIVIIARDISEKKMAQNALKESEEKYRALMEHASDPIFLIDESCNIVDLNEKAVALFGFSRKELLQMGIHDISDDEGRKKYLSVFQSCLKEGYISLTDIEIMGKDGEVIPVDGTGGVIEYGGRKMVQFILRDISKRKQVESELTKYRERLEKLVQKRTSELNRSNKLLEKDIIQRKKIEEVVRKERDFISSVLDTSAALVVVLDKDGKIVRFNKACIQTSGYSFQEVKGKYIWDFLIFSEDINRIKQNFSKTHLGFIIKAVEHSWITKDGSVRLISWAQTTINDSHGKIEYIILIGIDITEKRRVEEALRESEKLAAQGRMAAGIAHEINNPLGGIKNAFLLIKDAVPTDHQYYNYIDRIDSEIRRIAQIVHNMYDIYKPSEELSSEFSLKHLINDVVSLLNPESRSQGVRITSKLLAKRSIVHLPRGYVTQVLYNLIKNGVEASDKGKTVKINTIVNENEFQVSVSDEGVGIPKEDYKKIFEPFYSTKHQLKTGGLGLGLSVSKSLIEAMSGKMTFNSQIGKGTTFIITLPLSLPLAEVKI